jgi:mono/diheme cytochrome c family protein
MADTPHARRWSLALRPYAFGLLLAGLAATLTGGTPAAEPLDKDHAEKMVRGLDIFKKSVREVLADKCVKCHGGKKTEGNLDLSDRAELLKGGATGPAIVVGKGKESFLYQVLAHSREPHMPKNRDKLPDEAIAKIAEWIDNGAPYDAPLVTKAKTIAWTERTLPDDSRKFWSFQPLQRAELPAVTDAKWSRTGIDRFILAKLEAAKLTPNAAVERRKLIRRAYFDLIGLPPTPAEVDSFLNDPAADAYEKLLDRLLASDHFGERWARHWLDLARFAESHGFEHDYDRPSAYHYRDFVIEALNRDLPYDTFIKYQLAGDEYAPNDNLALKATGFLAAGVHSTQITLKEVEKQRYDELDDMLATTGTAMLGLTVGCARCHDHKFDPILQRDYYQMLSAFTTTVRSEVDMDMDPEGYKKLRAKFDEEHRPFAESLAKWEADKLPGRLAEWEKAGGALSDKAPWQVLEPSSLTSEGNATFSKLEDGSYLVGGPNPTHELFTIVATTDLDKVTSIRLEALAHPSLPHGGPGRAANGNFALTYFRVTAAPKKGGSPAVELKLQNPRATFEQQGLPIKSALTNDTQSGWAVDPEFGKDHAASFDVDNPVAFEGGTVLTFTLKFRNNVNHAIGRPRLSVTGLATPVELTGAALPASVFSVLKTPAEKRTVEQSATLAKWYRQFDPEWKALNQKSQEHLAQAPKPSVVKCMISTEGLPAIRLHTQGADFFPETHFLRRGETEHKEGVANLGFLQALTPADTPASKWQTQPPAGWRTSYRRRALAEWMTDVDNGAGRLLARVIVNRLWQHHMGHGLVGTPSDFGARGEAPTHPELLDWLATELIRNNWRLKPIHKLIMSSAVYMQDGQIDEAKAKIDRENHLWWRCPPRRLEGEVIRDTLLSVSGNLDPRMYGPGTLEESSKRRSIYFTVKRSKLVPMMQVFDGPDALGGIADRPTTTIAPQALHLMNNPFVRGYARDLAKKVSPAADTKAETAVTDAYLIALGRKPSADELTDSAAFVEQQAKSYQTAGKADGRTLAVADFCQVLLCLNEFVYVE